MSDSGVAVEQPLSRMQPTQPLAELLQRAAAGESAACRHLVEHVYPDLKRLARGLRRGRGGRTLNTTALVHECYMRLAPLEGAPQDRAHLTSLAVRIMRQVLVDHERARLALKRGGDAEIQTIAAEHAVDAQAFPSLVDIDSALTCLASAQPRRQRGCRSHAQPSVRIWLIAVCMNSSMVRRIW